MKTLLVSICLVYIFMFTVHKLFPSKTELQYKKMRNNVTFQSSLDRRDLNIASTLGIIWALSQTCSNLK